MHRHHFAHTSQPLVSWPAHRAGDDLRAAAFHAYRALCHGGAVVTCVEGQWRQAGKDELVDIRRDRTAAFVHRLGQVEGGQVPDEFTVASMLRSESCGLAGEAMIGGV